jgi:Permeases of the drug/metabolite transporter (DMT) superfamily
MKLNATRYYILAVLTVIIWSSTFIATKILLGAFTPIEILVYRFVLAYLLMFLVYPHIHRPESLKTELTLLFAGILGGSLYFVAENYALRYSLASNVSLLVSTAPILTAVLAHFFLASEKIRRNAVIGCLVAFSGAALVIFNGHFILKLNPLGDLLALVSSLSWAGYSILIRRLETRRSGYYITRKIFFYTLLTIVPVLFFAPVSFNLTPLLDWKLSLPLLFLTLFASCGAYVVWNKVIWGLGATKANNFIYFIPLLTLSESAILLSEPLTGFALAGAALIFAGVYITSRKQGDRDK